jgi:VWFA-related protein
MRAGVPHGLVLVTVMSAGLVAASSGDVAPEQAIPRVTYVTVLDADNAPVTGLTTTDIVVTEDGTARTVTDVKPAPDPLAVALLVDTSQPRMGAAAPTRDLRVALNAFVKIIQSANPESRIALMQTGGAAVTSVNFTASTSDLTRAINRLFPSQRTSAVVLEALVDMGRTMAKQELRRRAIVSIDFDSQESSGVTPDEISEGVQKSGASIWAVSIRGTDGGGAAREAVLDIVTEITGGLRFTAVSATALESQMTTIARALASQYLVSYERPNGAAVARVGAAATKGTKFLATRVIGG